jgi:hypothetical protein
MAITRNILNGLAILAAAQSVNAHSWVETIRRISPSGAYVGPPGYPMGYISRSDPNFDDGKVLNKILDTSSNPHVCGSFTGYVPSSFPPLTAAPGEFIALQYAENGHVSFPNLTPRGYRGGNVMVYGTPERIETIDAGINDILYQWNAEGTGGNRMGKLLASHFFDDGQCYQDKNGSPIQAEREAKYGFQQMLCQSAVKLPSDVEAFSNYSLVFIWDWPQHPNEPGTTTEIYTSCMTIDLRDNLAAVTSVGDISFADGIDISNAAIPSQVATFIEVEQRGTGTAIPDGVAGPTGVVSARGSTSGSHAMQ